MNVSFLLKQATEGISAALGLDQSEAAIEARALLCALLKCDRAWLIAHSGDMLENAVVEEYGRLVERRLLGEPVAYITGIREFYGMPFRVTQDVLIPRPETELIVDLALERMPDRASVLDLGTGSGAIAASIARLRKDIRVTALDKSRSALEIARENGREAANIEYVLSDWFDALAGRRYALIVSNPTYIAVNDEHLQHLSFEPALALASGSNGLDAIREIAASAPSHLESGGWLLIEHGYDQGEQCRALLSERFSEVQTWRDLSGIERVSGGRLTSD